MQSLVITVHELKWGKGDTKDAMLGRALTYLVLYSTLGMIVRPQLKLCGPTWRSDILSTAAVELWCSSPSTG
jgi:hypothetical protein